MSVATICATVRAAVATCLMVTTAWADDAPALPNALKGMEFKSVDKLEGGPLPEGTSRAHWTVRFTADEFHWHYTDVIEVGSYKWDAKTGTVEGKSLAGDRKLKGQYDAKSKTLTWEGKKYKLVEKEKDKK